MKKLFFIVFLTVEAIFIFPSRLYSQRFLISNTPAEFYTIDRISQTVYFRDFSSHTVRSVNLQTMGINETEYEILPAFANTKLNAAYALKEDNNPNNYNYIIYLYDLKIDTTYLLIDSAGYLYNLDGLMKFSPNDENLYYTNACFSLKDSSIKRLDGLSFDLPYLPEWSSDSTLTYISFSNSILEYNIYDKQIDTLVLLGQNDYISSYSYNKKHDILAYSNYSDDYAKMYFHYKDGHPDSVVFDSFDEGPPGTTCWDSGVYITSLEWSPNERRIAFFAFWATNPSSGIYVYDLDSNKIFHATDCIDYGNKDYLHWANNDTIIFFNRSEQRLYGFNIHDAITSVDFDYSQLPNEDFLISSYPNPFNLSTTFSIKTSFREPFSIKIYDVLGRLIRTIETGIQSNYTNTVTWDGRNETGSTVSSGVYIALAESGKKLRSNVIKIVLTK